MQAGASLLQQTAVPALLVCMLAYLLHDGATSATAPHDYDLDDARRVPMQCYYRLALPMTVLSGK